MERALLVDDVNEDRTRSGDIDARVSDAYELVCRSFDVAATIGDAERLGRLATEVEEVLGDVGEDDVRRAALEGAETNQSFAAADIEQSLTVEEPGTVENLVTDLRELPEHLALDLRIASEAVLGEPLGPDVPPAARRAFSP
jgi:hypothetical protein